LDRTNVKTEGIAQRLHRQTLRGNLRVDLIAGIGARIAERVPAGRNDVPAFSVRDRGLREIEIAVFDHDVAGGASPSGAPRPHAVAFEVAPDGRRIETFRELAVERTAASHFNRANRVIEVGHDGRKKAIAILPVVAGDVKRQVGVAAARVARKPYEGRMRRHPARIEIQRGPGEAIRRVASEWKLAVRTELLKLALACRL